MRRFVSNVSECMRCLWRIESELLCFTSSVITEEMEEMELEGGKEEAAAVMRDDATGCFRQHQGGPQ